MHIQLEPTRRFALVQVKRRATRHIQQAGVFQLALDLVVAPAQRVFKVVGNVLVEFLVFLVLDLGTRAGPERAGPVHALPLGLGSGLLLLTRRLLWQLNGQGNMVGVFGNDVAQTEGIGKLALCGLEVQDDTGTALGLVDGGDSEVTLTG